MTSYAGWCQQGANMAKTLIAILTVSMAMAGCDVAFTRSQKVQNQVRSYLNDPGSGKFETVFKGNDEKHYCGWVNAKNRMGAYVGSTKFIHERVTDDFGVVTFVASPPKDFEFKMLKHSTDFESDFKELYSKCESIAKWNEKCNSAPETIADSHRLCQMMLDPKSKGLMAEIYKMK